MSVERSELNVERSAPRGAVFLSYAREDSAAAQRIAEALRSHGVEVWFDQNELRGGDDWDARIRGQIRTCTLFLPIISAHTHERSEGYFRLEWKLGVERTHLMREGVLFLVPVVIDEMPEDAGTVPEPFTRVQWARLTAQLINAANGFHLWSDTFDRELKDIFALQDEIARDIAHNLAVDMMFLHDSLEAWRTPLSPKEARSRFRPPSAEP